MSAIITVPVPVARHGSGGASAVVDVVVVKAHVASEMVPSVEANKVTVVPCKLPAQA